MPGLTEQSNQDKSIDVYRKTWLKRIEARKHHLKEKKEMLLKLARNLADILRNEYFVEEIYLIGSLTRPYLINEYTDIDIMVKGLVDADYFPALARLYKDLPAGIELDLITMETASPELLILAKNERIVL